MPDFAFNPRFGVPWGHARPAALALTLALLAAPPCVKAQSETAAARPSCAALNANLPPALAAWPPKIDLISAVDAAHLSTATIRLGEAAQVALHSARDISFPVQPEKPSGPAAEGGLLTFMIDRAGVYRLALSSGAWIDVIKDAQPQPSIAHAHGPACSTIRKMVDFSLEPGRYVLQVSGGTVAEIGVLLAGAP